MTLQLAVKITGDASSLKREAQEARTATEGLGAALDAAGSKAAGAAGKFDAAGTAAGRLGGGAGGPVTPPGSQPAPPGARPAPSPAQRSGLRSDQWTNLGYQGNDIATSLAMGMSPMMVLAQQGPQVAQILSDAPGGIAGGFRIIGERVASILTPVRLLTGGFVGLGATFATLGYQWASSQKEIEAGLTGIGAMSRATAGDINRIAETAASGNRMSTGEARGVATSIAATGKVDVSNIGAVAGLAPGYAQLFGKSIEEAGGDLARIFADPVKGAEELNARIGGLDASTQRYIRTLVEQGRRQEAILVLTRQFGPEITKAAEATSSWGRAWNTVKSAADTVGGIVGGVTGNSLSLEGQVKEAERELTRRRALYGIGLGAEEGPEVAAQRKIVEALRQRLNDREAAPALKAAAEQSQTAEQNIRSLLPDLDQLDQLRNQVEQLRAAQGDLNVVAGLSTEARQRQNAAIETGASAIATFMTAQERARASEALTIRSIEARTAAEKAAIEAERQRLALAGQKVEDGEAERQRQIEAARRASFAQSTREAQDRLRSAEDAAAGAGLSGYPRRLAEMTARERRALEAAQGNLPAYADTQKAFGIERRAAAVEAISGPLRDADRSLTEQAAGLRIQQAAFGASTEAAERMAAAQQLVNRYTADGVPIEGDLRRAIDQRAAAVGKLAAAQEDLTRRQRAVVGSMDDMRYGLRGGLTGALGDVLNGRNPLDSLAGAAERTALSLFERNVAGPLASGLLGDEGKPGGGLLGDALGGLFGKAAGLPSADITAGVVNVSGPISGLGALAGAANGNTPGGSVASLVSGLRGGSDLDRYAAAIRTVESGSAAGNYGALGPLTKSGDRAYGAYQVMGNNIPSWTQKALGRTMTPDQFLGDRDAQDAVFRDQFARSVDRYGNPQDAASVWFTGSPLAQGSGRRDILGTTGSGYVDRFNKALGSAPTVSAPAASAVTAPLSNLDASLGTINSSAARAAEGVAGLSGDLSALPGPLSQTAQGLTQVSSSLGSGGGGGGLLSMIAQLFSGGAGASAGAGGTVAAATGGLITGPGTGTSDSILARVSNGEFIVRAEAARDKLPLLRALNENRIPAFSTGGLVGERQLPVFAAGGIVGQAPPAARPQMRERVA